MQDGCSAQPLRRARFSTGDWTSRFERSIRPVGNTCSTLWLGTYVCVSIVGVGPSPTPTHSKSTTTTPANGISTPTPIQTGMVKNCDAFHKVASGDEWVKIVQKYGISLSQFYSWNPAVGNTCSTLWLDNYVCVSIIGVNPVTPTPTTIKTSTTSQGNGVATPTPIQSGMITNCKTFRKVVKGDECAMIAKNAGISIANFYKWNPGIGSACQTLWLDYYVCIAIL